MMVQKIVVHNGNRATFEKILSKAVEEYRAIREKEIAKRASESEQFYDFDISKESFYNQHTDETAGTKNYVYEPCYLNIDRSNPEREFEKYLESKPVAKNIVWWWKNGENKNDYFGIKYEYPAGVVHTFYPDYLVQFNDGRIGIFEVKDQRDQDGNTLTKAKSEKLCEYIKEHSKKGKKLFGGIVIQVSGEWKINQNATYDWDKCLRGDWGDWKDLSLI
jgi:type III restriction enzyme